MGVLDDWFPGLALKRAQAQFQLSAFRAEAERQQTRAVRHDPIWENRYDGTGKGRRGSAWRTDDPTVAVELGRSLPMLRRRARDLWKNNGWARKACKLISTEAVGAGITCSLNASRGSARARDMMKTWMNSPTADVGGRSNFYGLQATVAQQVARDGEVFVRRLWKREPRSGVLLRFQVLGPEWLSSMKDGPGENGGAIIGGIEYNAEGDRVAYHFERTLNSSVWMQFSGDTVRVPASDVIHVYRLDEAQQERGVPWLAPCLWTLRDQHEFEDAHVMRQKLAACLVMKRTVTGTAELPGELGADGNARPKTQTFEPGTVQYLKQGEDAQFMEPPGLDGYMDFQKVSLRKIAAAVPVSYVALTNDYSDSNYAAARMEHHFMTRALDQFQWHDLVPHLCDGVLIWLHEALLLSSGAVSAEWTPPRRELLDPSKEIPPIIKAIRGGLTSRQEEIRKLGRDAEIVDEEQAADNKRADAKRLVFDSDGRFVEGKLTKPTQRQPADDDESPDDQDEVPDEVPTGDQ